MKTLNISIFIILTATLVVSGFFIFINKAQAEILYVCPEGPEECAYDSIQDAIDFATAGDIINVAAGTYDENINIDKSLTVVSVDGAEVTIINAQGLEFGVLIHGTGTVVTFDGFTVENYERVGILAGSFSLAEEDPDVVHILNNIVKEPIGQQNNNCIQIGDGTTGTVIGNEVMGASLESPDWSGSGIIVAGSSNVLVSYNHVHNSEGGIQIIGYTEYRDAPAENNIIEYNLVEDNESGIVPQMNSIGTIIRYNDVLNNDEGIAVMAIDYSWEHSTPSGTEIHYNNIVGNIDGVVSGVWGSDTGEVLAEEVDATENYWGASTGPNTEGADSIEGDVDFVPFYTDEAMEVLSTSYSVCAGGCNFATIQDAIDAVTSGDTINVAAGTYEEQVVIDKQLTLNGANVDVNAVIGTRGSESIIDGGTSTAITISADDVIVDGFTLDGGITLNDLANPISNGAISNNIITGADEPGGIKAQNGIRLGFDHNGKGVDHVTIENNTIINSLCKGIRFSNTKLDFNEPHDPQRISNITISNNEIKDNGSAGIETYGPGSNTIINNTISSNDGNGINLKFDDSDIVTGNTITDNTGPGITLRDVTNSFVENNTILDHKSQEVFKEFVESGGGEGSKGSGIHIVFASKNNTIRYNDVSNNNYGIFIHRGKATDKGQPSNNFIAQNKIVGNIEYGVFNALVDPPASVDARSNYWGDDDETGPEHVTTNTSGSGDEVSDNVDYSPWYTDDELTSLKAPTITDEMNNTVLELDEQIDIVANDIIVSMPAGITITATASWEGIINTPTIELVASDTPSPESGYNTVVDTVIEIGYPDTKLVFNKAVRILIPDQAGKKVGYTRTGEPFTEITNFCLDDIQEINDDLPPEGNCKIDVGNDLAVWTKHFTQFIVYSYSPIIITPTFRAETLPEEEPSPLSEEAQKLDTNKDDKIDDLDLKELFENWGSTILDNIADFNDDSKVDVFDFNLLMVHWTE